MKNPTNLLIVFMGVLLLLLVMKTHAFTERADRSGLVPFAFDVNSVNYEIDAWSIIEPNTLFTASFDVWLERDVSLSTTITHGTASRTIVVDPNGAKTSTFQWTYVTPTIEGVQYVDVVSSTVMTDPNDNRTRGKTFLLLVKKTPPIPKIRFITVQSLPVAWFWKVTEIATHPKQYTTATEIELQKDYQKFIKLTSVATERAKEVKLSGLASRGMITMPAYVTSVP